MNLTASDRFVMRQRVRLVINQYEFSIPDAEGDGAPICFVEQKRFKFKEDIRFYADDSKSTELMRIKARQRFDPRARYDVTAADGSKIGEIQKVFGESLLRSTYRLYDATGEEIATVREQNLAMALIRRVVGFLPYVGDVANWLPFPYNFEFLTQRQDGQLLGLHSRRMWKIRDVYDMDFTADANHVIDRRLALAVAVGLDALQAR